MTRPITEKEMKTKAIKNNGYEQPKEKINVTDWEEFKLKIDFLISKNQPPDILDISVMAFSAFYDKDPYWKPKKSESKRECHLYEAYLTLSRHKHELIKLINSKEVNQSQKNKLTLYMIDLENDIALMSKKIKIKFKIPENNESTIRP